MSGDDEQGGEAGEKGLHEVVPLRRAADEQSHVAGEEEALRVQLQLLKQEHRDMDAAIDALQRQGGDPFTIKRLKTQKLRLKDRIARIDDELNPDIIA